MNGIDALKAKFADVELKANARTMEEVVAYIEENWGAFRVKITESELMAHYKAACEFAKMMGKDVTDFQDDIRRYRLPNTNKIHQKRKMAAICASFGYGEGLGEKG